MQPRLNRVTRIRRKFFSSILYSRWRRDEGSKCGKVHGVGKGRGGEHERVSGATGWDVLLGYSNHTLA